MAAGRGGTAGRREVLVVLLAGAVVLVTALAGPLVPRWHEAPAWMALNGALPPPVPPTAPPRQLGGAQEQSVHVPGWASDTVHWLALAALAVLVFYLLRHVFRLVRSRLASVDVGGEGGEPAGHELLEGLDDVTQAALQEGVLDAGRALRRELPPGDAVIAAWLALEQAAVRGGVPHDPAQTATEFTLALLDRTRAEPGAARTLLRLYHRARFSDHEVTADDVAAARAALEVLAAALPGVVRAAGGVA